MKYGDLTRIGLDRIDMSSSIARLREEFSLTAPPSVIEQFYIDHSDDERFQRLYSHIDLTMIKWSLINVETKHFLELTNEATCSEYMNEVAEDASNFEHIGEDVISCIDNIRKHWKKNGSWVTPPVFINGNILQKPNDAVYHLVEGHTRVGCLKGLAKYKVIDIADTHEIYYGQY
ncbi:hypothetical protein [Thalassomonas sp. RHCl1]|uniref:hypothetical protein n=1 Tax=Thalassomonas sp. RHCl1 TaxID=2995320 RepID=UPI00248CB5F3|nr:hypothetical protein [Thalassomonas sp. RHCl1]